MFRSRRLGHLGVAHLRWRWWLSYQTFIIECFCYVAFDLPLPFVISDPFLWRQSPTFWEGIWIYYGCWELCEIVCDNVRWIVHTLMTDGELVFLIVPAGLVSVIYFFFFSHGLLYDYQHNRENFDVVWRFFLFSFFALKKKKKIQVRHTSTKLD